jgi:hypothetical protein
MNMHSLVIMNPGKPIRGKVKRKKTRSKKTTRNIKLTKGEKNPMRKTRKKRHVKKAVRRNPAKRRVHHRKRAVRRNPASLRRATSTISKTLPAAAGVAVGFIGARTLVNLALPKATGYVRAAGQAGAGLVLMYLSKYVSKKKDVHQAVLLGALASAILTVVDTITAGKYNLADETIYRGYTDYMPPAVMGDMYDNGRAIGTGMADSGAMAYDAASGGYYNQYAA